MDDLLEQRLARRSDQIHDSLRTLIIELDEVIIHNKEGLIVKDRIERSKPIFSKSKSLINEFEASPKLLDESLGFYIGKLTSLYLQLYNDDLGFGDTRGQLTISIAELVYNFAKIRGFKTVANYFSSDVYLISQIIELIDGNELHDLEVFLNLIWLSNLVMVPFPLETIEAGLSTRIFSLGIRHLTANSNASKTQLISLILLSRLITRDDYIKSNGLHDYFYVVVLPIWLQDSLGNKEFTTNQNSKLGHMMTINKILKRISNDELTKYIDFIYHELMEVDMINLRIQFESSSVPQLTNLNILYMIKILSKLSNFYLQLNNYSKVSTIVNNLLNDIMGPMLDRFDNDLRYCLSKNLSNLVTKLSKQAINYQEQLIKYMIEQLEIDNLQFEYSESHQIPFQTDLVLDANQLSISKFHTVLLFLAYITMNKSLPEHLIPVVLSIVHKTLFVVQRRLSTTLGTQLRDSSCFVIWALCRAIKKTEFTNLSQAHPFMMENVLFDLMKLIILDNDLIIRRCGIAVIQEFVGRFGTELFKPLILKQDDEELGKFIIQFIELFNNTTIGSLTASYEIIESLITIGIPAKLFIPLLLQNILDDDIAYSTKKLSSNHLVKILQLRSYNRQIEFQIDNFKSEQITIDRIFNTLIARCISSGPLYTISELLPLVDTHILESNNQLFEAIDNFKFDYHHDNHDRGESYLKFVNSALNHDSIKLSNSVWANIFSISRLKYNSELLNQLEDFFYVLKLKNIDIGEENLKTLIYYIKNNNLNLAKSLPCYQFDEGTFMEMIELVENTAVECDTRAMIIKGLNQNFKQYQLNQTILTSIVELLDDYTITNQGDVGSKIRLSVLDLIKQNPVPFSNDTVNRLLETKLIRLSGELIDRIKYESFRLLNGDHDFNEELYFVQLFGYYKNQVLRKVDANDHYRSLSISFWRGIIFSIASFTGSNRTINRSFNQFLRFLEQITDEEKEFAFGEFLELLKILQNEARELKVVVIALNLFIKLFESGFPFPKFNYNLLFIRCFNLQLNCANLTRIGLILQVWQHLLTNRCLSPLNSQRCVKKIVSMACCHPKAKVRNMGSEVLFEIAYVLGNSDIVEILDTLDWDTLGEVKKQYKSLDEQFVQLIDQVVSS